jgi:demethoxyubiquinone hydroxylase (CLK1/Coq7/Cat5 family)
MKYDLSIIRPQIIADDIKFKGSGMPSSQLKAIKNALIELHTLEMVATNIYKYQLTKEETELNRQLIAAMCNEMTHFQDFQIKLYEYGFKPNLFRWAYWIVGCVLGFWSRIRGRKAILKTGIWVEKKAVKRYAELLHQVDWDDDSRKVIEKNQADEDGHIDRWRRLLVAEQT